MSQVTRMLNLLRERPATSRDFIEMGIFKYSSRIAEMRRDGHVIEAKRVRGSLWKYTLKEKVGAGVPWLEDQKL